VNYDKLFQSLIEVENDRIIFDKSLYHISLGFLWRKHPDYFLSCKNGDRRFYDGIDMTKYLFKCEVYTDKENFLEKSAWCFENVKYAWSRVGYTMYFTDKKDATLFKLFWV
jgi:hypothetical protein